MELARNALGLANGAAGALVLLFDRFHGLGTGGGLFRVHRGAVTWPGVRVALLGSKRCNDAMRRGGRIKEASRRRWRSLPSSDRSRLLRAASRTRSPALRRRLRAEVVDAVRRPRSPRRRSVPCSSWPSPRARARVRPPPASPRALTRSADRASR